MFREQNMVMWILTIKLHRGFYRNVTILVPEVSRWWLTCWRGKLFEAVIRQKEKLVNRIDEQIRIVLSACNLPTDAHRFVEFQ